MSAPGGGHGDLGPDGDIGGGRAWHPRAIPSEFADHTLISRWMRRYRRTGQVSALPSSSTPALPFKPAPVPRADQAAEIARLKREVEQLRMKREVLKKGIAIFAAPVKRLRLHPPR